MFKKLAPAFLMLLVSAILLATSTYAWFSMNTTVTATGMSITAEADNPFLMIQENGKTGDWTEEATLTADGANLSLIHPTTIDQSSMTPRLLTPLLLKPFRAQRVLQGARSSRIMVLTSSSSRPWFSRL